MSPCSKAARTRSNRAPCSDRKSTRLNSSHTEIYTLSLHDALPISAVAVGDDVGGQHGLEPGDVALLEGGEDPLEQGAVLVGLRGEAGTAAGLQAGPGAAQVLAGPPPRGVREGGG